MSGGTLKNRLAEPLLPRDAARLTETIVRAVGYFHTRGLVHLDLKPSNILLDREPGRPGKSSPRRFPTSASPGSKASRAQPLTRAERPKGTPSYMAPEQVAAISGTIGPAADLYALGALLHHL